jgi:hypothetical protein
MIKKVLAGVVTIIVWSPGALAQQSELAKQLIATRFLIAQAVTGFLRRRGR